MSGQSIENFRHNKSEIEHNPNCKRRVVVRRPMRMSRMIVRVRHLPNVRTSRRAARCLNASALEQGAKNFFGFEKLAGDFAGGERVAGVIGVDALHGFGDFA